MFIEYYKGMIDAYKNVQDWIDEGDSVSILTELLRTSIENIEEEQNL